MASAAMDLRTDSSAASVQLSAADERLYAVRMRAGDPAARERLFFSVQRFAHQIAHDCLRRVPALDYEEHYEDLEQEADLTLWKVLPDFDPARGCRLMTFVGDAIQRDVIRKRNDLIGHGVHIPVTVQAAERAWFAEAIRSLSHTPDTAGPYARQQPGLSLEEVLPDTDSPDWEPGRAVEREQTSALVAQVVEALLTVREAAVMALLHQNVLDGKPPHGRGAAVGRTLGISRQRVNQLYHRALDKLRAADALALLAVYGGIEDVVRSVPLHANGTHRPGTHTQTHEQEEVAAEAEEDTAEQEERAG